MSDEEVNKDETPAPEAEAAETPAPEAQAAPEADAKAEAPKAETKPEAEAKPKAEKPEKPKADAKAKAEDGEAKKEDDEGEAAPKLNPTAKDLLSEGDPGEEKIKKIKGSKNVPNGIVFIKATFNNTAVTITDLQGNTISWSTGGKVGFKGSRKSTAYAASQVAADAARAAQSHGMNEVEVRVQGPGAGRESAIRAIQATGLRINAIKDTTPIPHNGCRPRKRRRV